MDDRETVERIYKGLGGLVPMLMFAAMCGCGSNDSDHGPDLGSGVGPGVLSGNGAGVFYSGNFYVTNESDRTIVIQNWENFGEAQPGDGIIVPGNLIAGSFFPNLDRFPDSTSVSWVYEGDTVAHSQTISLTGVVPANTEGYTEFIFDSTGVWTVRFVPGAQ